MRGESLDTIVARCKLDIRVSFLRDTGLYYIGAEQETDDGLCFRSRYAKGHVGATRAYFDLVDTLLAARSPATASSGSPPSGGTLSTSLDERPAAPSSGDV